jgi:hypothetical protein
LCLGRCDNFPYGFKGRTSGAPAPDRWPRREQGREIIERGSVIEMGTTTRTAAGGSGGPAGRLQGGGHAALSRAEALTGAPPPPGQQARTRRSAVPAVTPRRWPRLQKPGLARPPCRASSRRKRSQSRALPAVASPQRWAQAPTLECDLARQDLGTYRKDGGNQDIACITARIVPGPRCTATVAVTPDDVISTIQIRQNRNVRPLLSSA